MSQCGLFLPLIGTKIGESRQLKHSRQVGIGFKQAEATINKSFATVFDRSDGMEHEF